MVIKYKAKFIRDGSVVIDDTALIELGSDDTSNTDEQSKANSSHPKSKSAWEKMIAESEERVKDPASAPDSTPAPDDDPVKPEK